MPSPSHSSTSRPRYFISYARTELIAIFGEDALWQDRARMEGGKNCWKQITDALEQVDFMILIASPHAMVSDSLRRSVSSASY